MHERPIADLVDALRVMGADIRYAGQNGYPPLAIGPGLAQTETAIASPVAVRGDVSSQFVSALLMAAPLAGAGRHDRSDGGFDLQDPMSRSRST